MTYQNVIKLTKFVENGSHPDGTVLQDNMIIKILFMPVHENTMVKHNNFISVTLITTK